MRLDQEMSLQIEGLCKTYPEFQLRDVSFSIPKGSIMGLIGVNGAGKSTTMKAILGLIQPEAGEIAVLGKEHSQIDNETRGKIGVVFDECTYNQTLTAPLLNKVLAGIYPTWDKAQFDAFLKQFRLPPKTKLKDYSRGMKMKLSVAAALSHHAKLLILDEPTSGLDPIVRNEILDLFLDYIQDGENSILISSHITNDLEKIADYITFIDQGRVVLSDTKDNMIYGYEIAKGTQSQISSIQSDFIVSTIQNRYDVEALIRNPERFHGRYPDIVTDKATLETIMMFLVGKSYQE